MKRNRQPLSRVVRSTVATFAVIFAFTGAAPPPPPAATEKAKLARIEPLPPVRIGPQPLQAIRPLSLLQERIATGDETAFERQGELAAEIDRQLKAFPVGVWNDARNRHALIKHTLSGGNPDLLRAIAERKMFVETEIPLAHGALAYAEGHRMAARTRLEEVNILKLAPSLAGHVALIKAIVWADADPVAARRFSESARLLSPGTLVEEAALRLSVELHIATGDDKLVEADGARLLRRFPRSKYIKPIIQQLVWFVAARDYASTPARKVWLEYVSSHLAQDSRADFFIMLAETSLRFGKIVTAAYAAQMAAFQGADRALTLAYEGSALVVSATPARGLKLLAAAEAFAPAAATNELIEQARLLGVMIEASPDQVAERSPGGSLTALPASSAQLPKVRNAILLADKLLKDTAE